MTEQEQAKEINELMKPRYKVIADYPNSVFKTGSIIETIGEGFIDKIEYYQCAKYPHLFRKLEWWEERTIEEMKSVKKVKIIEYRGYWRVGDIVPVLSFQIGGIEEAKPYGYILAGNHWQPVFELEPAPPTLTK